MTWRQSLKRLSPQTLLFWKSLNLAYTFKSITPFELIFICGWSIERSLLFCPKYYPVLITVGLYNFWTPKSKSSSFVFHSQSCFSYFRSFICTWTQNGTKSLIYGCSLLVIKNIMLYIFLCPSILQNSLISSNSFLLDSIGFST